MRHARSGGDDLWRDRRARDGDAGRDDRDPAPLARQRPSCFRRRARFGRHLERRGPFAPGRARHGNKARALAGVPAQRRPSRRDLRAQPWAQGQRSHDRQGGDHPRGRRPQRGSRPDAQAQRQAVAGAARRLGCRRHLALRLAEGPAGVVAEGGGPHPDAEIKASIQADLDKLALGARASVRVEVAKGVVTFEGAITTSACARASR